MADDCPTSAFDDRVTPAARHLGGEPASGSLFACHFDDKLLGIVNLGELFAGHVVILFLHVACCTLYGASRNASYYSKFQGVSSLIGGWFAVRNIRL